MILAREFLATALDIWGTLALIACIPLLLLAFCFLQGAAHERHMKRLKKEAEEALERDARNRVLPVGGKAASTIWR